jgi:hypothetical protein
VGTYPTAINDDGEQARFLVSTSGQNLVYLFRLHPDGSWNQISSLGTGSLTTYGIGSIAPDGTVTATIQGNGYIAFGIDGETEPLADLVSCTYGGGAVTVAGPQNDLTGDILAEIMIGLEPRLVILRSAEPCTSDCVGAGKLTLGARFVQDPQHPGQCFAGGAMFNQARASVIIKDDQGNPVQGAEVFGRFMDEYWENELVTDVTNAAGEAEFFFEGPCGVGTISFLVDDVIAPGFTFDPTRGKGLVVAKIPQ